LIEYSEFALRLESCTMLGHSMYSQYATLVCLVSTFQAFAADSQPSTSQADQVTPQQMRQIDDEWYNALRGTQRKLRQTKNEYDNYYFYSNGCAALVLFCLVKKMYDKKFSAAAHSVSQPLLQADAETQRTQPVVTDVSIEAKYDEIQKRWDEKVTGAQDKRIFCPKPSVQHDQLKAVYDQIQDRWDHKVLGA